MWEGTKDDKGQEEAGAGEVAGAGAAAAGAGVAGTLEASSGSLSRQFTSSGDCSSSPTAWESSEVCEREK